LRHNKKHAAAESRPSNGLLSGTTESRALLQGLVSSFMGKIRIRKPSAANLTSGGAANENTLPGARDRLAAAAGCLGIFWLFSEAGTPWLS
jgi:hypothetical protein